MKNFDLSDCHLLIKIIARIGGEVVLKRVTLIVPNIKKPSTLYDKLREKNPIVKKLNVDYEVILNYYHQDNLVFEDRLYLTKKEQRSMRVGILAFCILESMQYVEVTLISRYLKAEQFVKQYIFKESV